MITGLGIGLVGFGIVLVYAGVTGQHVKEELTRTFAGAGPDTGGAIGPVGPQAAPTPANPLPGGVGGPNRTVPIR